MEEATTTNNNLHIYEMSREVPDNAKRAIEKGRMKGKTNINTQWRLKKLTELFGPIGKGWYYRVTRQWTETSEAGDVAAFVNIELYVKFPGETEWSKPIEGNGGNMLVKNEESGNVFLNDEAYKMATSDAISVAAKQLGIGADVYFEEDSNKYDAVDKADDRKRSASKPSDRQAAYQKDQGGLSNKSTRKPELNPLSKAWTSAVAKAAGSRNSDDVLRKNIEKTYNISDKYFEQLMQEAGRHAVADAS